jgi:hypothetical protein
VSEELCGGTIVELEDSNDFAELEGSICDELDTDSTDALDSVSEDADERLPTSADESGFAKDCAGNCGFESLPQLAQKNDATVKQLRRQNLRIFIKFLLLLSNI